MCSVVVSFDPGAAVPVVLLGLRDELADRPWDPPAAWWPELGDDVEGLRDREAGGAWLATSRAPARLAVVLNRHERVEPPEGGFATRGDLPLRSVVHGDAARVEGPHPTRPFNLVEATPDQVTVTSWDGAATVTSALGPGVHLVTHGAVDDRGVPRVARWLDAFRAAPRPRAAPPAVGRGEGDWTGWLDVLRDSARLDPEDDEALVRSDRVAGRTLRSLSLSLVALGPDGAEHAHVRLDPARTLADELAERASGGVRP